MRFLAMFACSVLAILGDRLERKTGEAQYGCISLIASFLFFVTMASWALS